MPTGLPDWHKPTKADIVEQTIENLNVNINAQSLPQIINFTKVGLSRVDSGAFSFGDTIYNWLLTVEGSGCIYFILVKMDANQGSHQCGIMLKLDDQWVLDGEDFYHWNAYGFSSDTWPFRLLKYAADGEIVALVTPPFPITFQNKMEFGIYSGSGLSQSGYRRILYALL